MHKFEWTVQFASALKRRILEESRTNNESRGSQNLNTTKGSYNYFKAVQSFALDGGFESKSNSNNARDVSVDSSIYSVNSDLSLALSHRRSVSATSNNQRSDMQRHRIVANGSDSDCSQRTPERRDSESSFVSSQAASDRQNWQG